MHRIGLYVEVCSARAHKIWICESYTFCSRSVYFLFLFFRCIFFLVHAYSYTCFIHRYLESNGCVRLKILNSIYALIAVSSHWCLREISVGRWHSKVHSDFDIMITAFKPTIHHAYMNMCSLRYDNHIQYHIIYIDSFLVGFFLLFFFSVIFPFKIQWNQIIDLMIVSREWNEKGYK